MRLYLSSYKLGDQPEKLVELAGLGARTAVIMNARDAWPEHRLARTNEEIAELKQLGFDTEELDLRNYFGDPKSLTSKLKNYDLVYVSGGNAFVLRRAMQQSCFDKIILDLLSNDSIVYSGYSAGVCVMTPTLKGIELL